MKTLNYLTSVARSCLLLGILLNTASGAQLLMNVDFGGDTPSGKTGTAAIGNSATDFWNVYLRNDGNGGWRTHGVMNNLLASDGTTTAVGMTVDNAAGAWGLSFSDPMYNDYIYPYPPGGNATITLNGLSAGLYDLYTYSADGTYEVSVGGLSYGTRLTSDPARNGASIWTEGVQYARFRNVALNGSQALTLTVRDGVGGYAIISGLQLVAVPEPGTAALFGLALLASLGMRRARQGAGS